MSKIAEGSVILTLDARQLNAGLQAAAANAKKASAKIEDALKPKKAKLVKPEKAKLAPTILEELSDRWKGLSDLGKAGVVAGIVAGVAFAVAEGFKKIAEGVRALAEKAADLKEKILSGQLVVSPRLSKGVAVVVNSVERIQNTWDRFQARLLTSLAPAFDMFADLIGGIAPQVAPLFEWFGRQISEITSIGLTLIEVVEGIFAPFLKWLPGSLKSLGELLDIENQLVFTSKSLAFTAGYAWDAQRVAVGGVVLAVGTMVKALAGLVDKFRELGKVADLIPDMFKPDWLRAFAGGIKGISSATNALGDQLIAYGTKEVNSFGSTFAKFNSVINAFFANARNRRNKALREADALQVRFQYQPSAPLEQGSKEFASARARFTAEALTRNVPKDVQKEQLKEQKKANDLLNKVVDGVNRSRVVFDII